MSAITTDPKEIDIYKHQFEQYWKWSQFYHDAEIKLNAGAVAISSLAPLVEKLTGTAGGLTTTLFGLRLNLIGFIIMAASAAAIMSIFVYWRYYELCDIYAKEFRKKFIAQDVLDEVRYAVDNKFVLEYPGLRRIPLDAHHYLWFAVQALIFCFGFYITFVKA